MIWSLYEAKNKLLMRFVGIFKRSLGRSDEVACRSKYIDGTKNFVNLLLNQNIKKNNALCTALVLTLLLCLNKPNIKDYVMIF